MRYLHDDKNALAYDAFLSGLRHYKPALPAPALPAARKLGVILWSDVAPGTPDKLAQIIDAVENGPSRFTVVESGHGVGKSIIAGALVAWWLETKRPDAKVVTLAPTFVQVNAILWSYIRKYHQAGQLSGTIFETPQWRIGPECFAIGLSPRKATREDLQALHGYHSPNLLVIMDEGPGLPRLMWEAVHSLVTGANNKILALGNPIEQMGPFWEATQSENWNYFNINCLEHPNVAPAVHEDIDPPELIPGAVSAAWVDEMVRNHCLKSDGPGSIVWRGQRYEPGAVFMSRVLGRAPTEASDQLIPLKWVVGAQSWVAQPTPSDELVFGFDPSRVAHGDHACLVSRRGALVIDVKRRKVRGQNPGQELAGWLHSEARAGVSRIYVDETGIGASVVDHARNLGLPIVTVSPGSRASARNMANKRAEIWWRLRERLETQSLSLPQDDMLTADITAPKFWYDASGRILLEPKEQIKGRLGRSPDSGDALTLTLAMEDRGVIPIEAAAPAKQRSRWTLSTSTRPNGSRWKR